MFARVARYQVPPEQVDQAIEGFREAGLGLQELEGMVGGYLLVDAESGTLQTFTLWDNQRSLEQSQTRAASLRHRAVSDVDGSVESVAEYEVALEFGGHTRDLRESPLGG